MTAVLLINADMTPMHTIPLQRAISLIAKNKVDVVECVPGKVLRSPSVTWPFPSVLRLKYYRNVPRRKMTYSRRAIFSRDGYQCQYCGTRLSYNEATIDHVIPVEQCKRMGTKSSSFGNCVCACKKCNTKKANRNMRDAGMKFFNPEFEPRTPRTNYLVVSSEIPIEWRAYIQTK